MQTPDAACFFVPMMTLIAVLTVVARVLLFYLVVFLARIGMIPTLFLFRRLSNWSAHHGALAML
jgi:hypothetical protein